MRGLSILDAKPIATVTASAGDGVQFLRTPDPKEVWRVNAGQTVSFDVDFGLVRNVDTVFLGYAFVPAGTQWRVLAWMGGAEPQEIMSQTPFAVPGGVDDGRHGLLMFPAPVATRFLRIEITLPTGSAADFGVFASGLRFAHAYEYKAGRRLIDMSERVELFGGGFGFGAGAIKSSYRFTFSELDDAELKDLWRIVRSIGNSSPVLLVEGGDDSIDQEMIHYGVFERFEAFEREDPQDTRWSLSMVDWV